MIKSPLPALSVLAAFTFPATAAEPTPGAVSQWSGMVGAGAQLRPEYEGSDECEIAPMPVFRLAWEDRVTLALRKDAYRF